MYYNNPKEGDSYTDIPIGDGAFVFRYKNYHELIRPPSNEERYEGYMRSDFSSKKIHEIKHEGCIVVKIK